MASTELQTCAPPQVEIAEFPATTIVEPPPEFNAAPGKLPETKTASKAEDSDSCDDDISAVQIASTLIEQTLAMDDSESVVPDNQNEDCKKIMIVCSNTAQDIKKSLNDVLLSRSVVTVTEDDSTSQLQTSLNARIADFEKTVNGCLKIESDFKITEITEDTPHVSEPIEDIPLSLPESSVTLEKEDSPSRSSDSSCAESDKAVEPCDPQTLEISKNSYMKQSPVSRPLLKSTETTKDILKNIEEKVNRKSKNVPTKKKIEKNIDLITKSLASCPSTEEKLTMLSKKHAETLEEYRLVEPRLKQLERQVASQQREKELLQAEHNRIILAKSRLESLCREMQRQSKAVKEESLQRIREEEEKRKDVANKFQATLNDISSLMQENSKKNIQLREENVELANKLKGLVDNYEVWEQNMHKVIQQKELEAQLAKAKQAKVNLLLKQETEKFLREKQTLLETQTDLQKRCTVLTQNELQLRTELTEYTSKYDEFQSVLSNSSKVFATFKTDMEATSKKIKKLEKETNVYKQKWTISNNALVEMISHKEKQDKEFANAQQRIATLEKLCRALQAERNDLRNQLDTLSTSPVSAVEKEVPVPSIESAPV